MSAYHNQTNISPGTLFSGLNGNFPEGITIGNTISIQGGANALVIQPASELFLGDGAGGTARYNISTISYVGATPGSVPFLTWNGAANPSFQLANLSSLNAGAFTVNAVQAVSSLKGYGWAS